MINSCKRLLAGTACALLLAANASAQNASENDSGEFISKIASGENVVLFKIHDVVPIKDENGIVTDCEFGLTLYNRSPKSVDEATIELSWKDEGIASVITAEENQDDVRSASHADSFRQAKQPKTSNFETEKLSTSVILPQIKPFRQVSLKSKIKSDRCFLMLEEVDFSFSSCSVTDQASTVTSKRLVSADAAKGSGCKSLFRFVSPRDPEYYREFQKVAFNEEAKNREDARKKDINEMDETYNKMLDAVNNVTTLLDSIK